ncbi:inner membrane protein [Klebsiella pneumoniae]|nr:inner membrane protein [Klebsiella pneumoniae]
MALQGLELTPLHQARIAMLFCLPVLELGIEWLDGFHEVLIYPAPFIVDDEWEDDIGLVHNQRVVQSGQSWQQGPVVLNWLDIQDSFDASGFNLVVHEVAHKLDTRNGDRASGVPLIPLREVAGWEHDLHAAMNNIQDEIDLVGESAASIDAYAATDPAECFAVLSEYFFSAPELFAPRFPALWQRFCHFYRQDPLARRRENGLQDEGDRRIVH